MPKFLALAVQMRKITEQTRKSVLDTQYRQKVSGEPHTKAGEIAMQYGLSKADRDEILFRQKRPAADSKSNPSPAMGRQLAEASLATIGVLVAIFRFDVSVDRAIVISGFLTYLVESIIQYKGGRSIPAALQRAAPPLITLVVASLVFFSVYKVATMHHDPSHLTSSAHAEEEARIHTIWSAFSAMGAAVGILLLYSAWKFQSARFAQSRLGAVKDILIRVETILQGEEEALSVKQAEAVNVVLKGLRNAIRLSPADRIMRWVSIIKPSFNQARVLFFIPKETNFHLFDAAYPERVSDEVNRAFKWIRENHRPAFLNQPEFEELKELARTASPDNWRKAYLNLPQRHRCISVCGWIHDKQEILTSEDASTCLALDNSFLRRMEEAEFDTDALRWVEVGSFVGCRVKGRAGRPAGVLLVIKNIRKGFPPEDLEVVVTAGQILGRILQTA